MANFRRPAPIRAVRSGTAASSAPQLYTVILKSGGANKLAVVKLVKDVTGLGLKEAKDLVDQAPRVVKEHVDRATAIDLAKQLTDAGAEVAIEPPIGGLPQAPEQPPGDATFTVILEHGGANKLQVVKIVKDVTGLGLKEAKDLVDQAPKAVKEGVDQATAIDLKKQLTDAGAEVEIEPPIGGAPPQQPPADPNSTTFAVILVHGGANKLQVVKIVKDVTGLGLKEAKGLVDQAPNIVKENVDRPTAIDLKKQLTDAGAEVEIQPPIGGTPQQPQQPPPADPNPTTFDVILVNGGANKLQVVKIVKDVTGLGLKEAKDLVDQAPRPVKTGVDRATAVDLKKQLTDGGATVTIEPPTETVYRVTLLAPGPDRAAVIAVLRAVLGLDAARSQQLVDTTPSVLAGGTDLATASALKEQLAVAGARFSIDTLHV